MAKLRNGKYDSKEHDRKWRMGDGYDWLGLDWVRFMGENSEFAIVSFAWVTAGGSTSDYGVVQVFTLLEGHPVVVQQILYNIRGCPTSADLSTRLLLFTIRGVHGMGTLLPEDNRRCQIPLGRQLIQAKESLLCSPDIKELREQITVEISPLHSQYWFRVKSPVIASDCA